MINQDSIYKTFTDYLKALYSQNFNALYELVYEADLILLRNAMVDMAKQIDEIGESTSLLKAIKLSTLEELNQLSAYDFFVSLLKHITVKVGSRDLKKIISELVITSIEDVGYYSIVNYEYPVKMFGEWDLFTGDIHMINTNNEWRVLFKSGLINGMAKFKNDISQYLDRKQRDNINNLTSGTLQKFSLYGYRDAETGTVVLEPKYKDAGSFSEGLAYIKIIRKYGYINTHGDIVIKPQFEEAKTFSEQIASVKILNEEDDDVWGFINTNGEFIITAIYKNTGKFSEGLCAVEIDDKWGYIDKNGTLIIPPKFYSATNFENGVAEVGFIDLANGLDYFKIDKTGKIIEV